MLGKPETIRVTKAALAEQTQAQVAVVRAKVVRMVALVDQAS
jgi:hypothetical protein